MPAGHGAAATESEHSMPMAHLGSQRAGAFSTEHGAMCVSTPARERTQFPVGGLANLGAVPAARLAARPRILGCTGRHGPPPTVGRSLLIQVGIART
ncbi:hypothetical protein [Streptomyces sp. NBC_00344]|uniref:hypothetical protein n=1 Tax=Streptomyces sp. NBC_00344 TaxID=2975720 RepID=UPI002E213E30